MKRVLLSFLIVVLSAAFLVGCKKKESITIWVGVESVDFYEAKMDEYVEDYKEKEGKDFPYDVKVLAIDTGTAAGTFMDDPQAGADIFTVANDNIGRLTAGSSAIAPVQSQALLDQIAEDNPAAFLDVIKSKVDGTEYTFGVPYVAQSLVLFYNTSLATPEQSLSFEGLMEAAAAKSATTKATVITDDDGFNNSFLLLARNKANLETSLKLFPGGVAEDSFGTGDDTISVLKWGQRFFTNPNGGMMPDSDGWEKALKEELVLSVIGGAWHYNAAKSALGTKLGVEILPSFTLTEQDAYGTIAAGTEFQSGSFTDAKVFVMKKGNKQEKQEYIEDVILFLTSKEVQEESFIAANNLPAYKNAPEEFDSMKDDSLEVQLAVKQLEMFDYGISQPFGAQAKFNTWYYSKNGPALINEILKNTGNNFTTHAQIKAQMEIVEHIWKFGTTE